MPRSAIKQVTVRFALDGSTNSEGTAAYLDEAHATLAAWRPQGKGQFWAKDRSGPIRYRRDDLDGFNRGDPREEAPLQRRATSQ